MLQEGRIPLLSSRFRGTIQNLHARSTRFRDQLLFRFEMSIEATVRQACGRHDFRDPGPIDTVALKRLRSRFDDPLTCLSRFHLGLSSHVAFSFLLASHHASGLSPRAPSSVPESYHG